MKKDDHTEKTLSRRNFLKTTGNDAAVTAMTIGGASMPAKEAKAAANRPREGNVFNEG